MKFALVDVDVSLPSDETIRLGPLAVRTSDSCGEKLDRQRRGL